MKIRSKLCNVAKDAARIFGWEGAREQITGNDADKTFQWERLFMVLQILQKRSGQRFFFHIQIKMTQFKAYFISNFCFGNISFFYSSIHANLNKNITGVKSNYNSKYIGILIISYRFGWTYNQWHRRWGGRGGTAPPPLVLMSRSRVKISGNFIFFAQQLQYIFM